MRSRETPTAPSLRLILFLMLASILAGAVIGLMA